MKTKLTLFALAIYCFMPLLAEAQEKNYQAFWVHEDRVKPGMVDEYEQVTKDLVAACKEHNIQDVNWLALRLNDNRYMYVSPVEKFADLDKNGFAALAEKMGEDEMNALFDKYNGTYGKHGDYMVYLQKDLSYMPGGISTTVEGENYRTMYFHYVAPGHDKDYMATLKKIKASFEKHNSKIHYRVYKSGFGTMGPYYMVAVAAKDATQSAQRGAENWELMKGDLEGLFAEMNKYMYKTDEVRGWIMSDLTYVPAK